MSREQIGFTAFLHLTGNDHLIAYLQDIAAIEPIANDVAKELERLVHIHIATGFDPEVIDSWVRTGDLDVVDTVIDRHIQHMIAVYASETHKTVGECIALWKELPSLMARENTRFRHTRRGDHAGLAESLLLSLEQEELIRRVRKLERPELPMEPYVYQSQFKLYFADTGIFRRLARLPASIIVSDTPQLSRFRGTLTESYVLNELEILTKGRVCYWKSGNTAEVDFVIPLNGNIIPIEVKAAKNVKSHSLALYRQLYSPGLALRFSLLNLKHDDDLINIPLYLVEELPRIVELTQ